MFITSALGDALCKQTLLYTYLHNNHTNVTNVSLRPFVLLPAQFCVLIVLITSLVNQKTAQEFDGQRIS